MNFFRSLVQKFAGKPVDWDELEEALIRADLGVPMTLRIIASLQERATTTTITANDVAEVARDEIARSPADRPGADQTAAGKTESDPGCRRQRNRQDHFDREARALLQKQTAQVLLAAADTFRAAAIEQLGIWAERIGVEMIRGQYHADPAALCYDAYQAADRQDIEFLLCDTAGRLHTKSNLMAELDKVKRSIAKHDPKAPHETLLVVDATTGSNALAQAREFHQAIGLTGLIVTKLDGSGKGGIVIAIQDELGIPTRFVGTGEKLEDFEPFDGRDFIAKMV